MWETAHKHVSEGERPDEDFSFNLTVRMTLFTEEHSLRSVSPMGRPVSFNLSFNILIYLIFFSETGNFPRVLDILKML